MADDTRSKLSGLGILGTLLAFVSGKNEDGSDYSGAKTKDNGPAWASSRGVNGATVTSADMSGADANLTDAPAAGQKLVITDVEISVDTAMRVDLKEQTSGTLWGRYYLPANSTLQITPRGKKRLATADRRLVARTSAAGNVAITATYYSEA